MTQPEYPPEGWFPDPQDASQLRYWSGSEWTEHTAPYPVQQPPAPAQTPQTFHQPQALIQPQVDGQPQPSNGPQPYGNVVAARPVRTGPGAWTRQTFIVLGICVALVIASVVTAGVLRVTQRGDHRAAAQQTLEQFLATATVGDDKWRNFASESLQQKVPVGAPIFGEAKTAEALELSIDYTLGELEYYSTDSGSLADRDDNAVAAMTVTYNFVFDGKQHSSEAQQKVWLTRPFYFGSDLPQTAKEGGEPSSVGPWRVTSFTYAEEPSDLMLDHYYKTDLVDDYNAELDENLCYSSLNIMQEIATFARVDGDTRSSCQVGDGSGTLVGDEVDRELIATEFPVLENELTLGLYSLPELTRIPQYDQGQPLPPFQEYLVTTSAGQYVFTIALVDVGEGLTGHTGSARFVSVQAVEETEASDD